MFDQFVNMSQLPRLKRVADIQHPNIGRVDNGDPEHAHFLEDSKDLSYFAKRHRRPPLDEVVQIVELSSASSSSSYFSEEEEDEANKYERVFPSNTHGNPLYIRPGRCQVNNGIMHAPHPKVDIMLTTISFVMAAVHVACLAEGKNFSLPPSNRRANNSFYYPLEGLKTDLWALYVGIGSWSRRFKQMEWEELKLSTSFLVPDQRDFAPAS